MTPARLGSGQRTRLSGAALLSLAALTFAGVMSMQAVTATQISAGETAYRYWSFWVGGDDAWTYATQGPATMAAADGMTLGWRFGIATERDTSALEPQLTPVQVWEASCAAIRPQPGLARVAFALDFGSSADAPAGEIPPDSRNECAVVDEGSSLARALSSVSVIRDESGLICSFDGYPASECAPVMTVEASASSDSRELGNSLAPDHGAASQGSGDNLSVQGVESSSPIRSVVFGAGAVTALFITIALLLTRHSSRRARRAP